MGIIDTRDDLKPIFQAKPDMRFGTTFLSNKYRDYAVNGESIMDKATGEIFTKRPTDGRVVSFFQNQKFIDDMMLELRVLLTTHPELQHPDSRDFGAFFLSTDFDVMSIHNEKDIDIQENDIVIDNEAENPFNRLKFNISNKSNGFTINITTRNSDKVIVEYATGLYNKFFYNYRGTADQFHEEARKFTENEKWMDSNATLTYEVVIKYRDVAEFTTYEFTDYVRVNEQSCVLFPPTLSTQELATAEAVNVRIKSIKFEKLHKLIECQEYIHDFDPGYTKLLHMDGHIYVRYITVGTFINSANEIVLLGNEFLVALADMPYVYRCMNKLSSLMTQNSHILSTTRPDDDIWKPNALWAERLRDVYKNGYTIDFETETDIHQLALYLANNDDTEYVDMSETAGDDDILLIRSDE